MLKSSVFSPGSEHPLGPVLHFRSSECFHRRFPPLLFPLLRALVGLYLWVYVKAWMELNWVPPLPQLRLAKGIGVCAHHCVCVTKPPEKCKGKMGCPREGSPW